MKEDMALSPTPTPFRKKKLTWKQSLTVILVMVCLSLLGEMARGIKITFNNRWKEEGYAYDVKEEYYIAAVSGGIRKWLVHWGWKKDGAILALFHWIHGKAYASAMKQIPEDDGERELWYFDYKIYPEIQKNAGNDKVVAVLMTDVLENFDAIVKKPIKSVWLREVEKPDTLRLLFNYYFNNKDLYHISENKKHLISQHLIEESFVLLEHMDVKKIISSNVRRMTALQYADSLNIAISQNIRSKYFNCNDRDIQLFQLTNKKFLDLKNMYLNYKLNTEEKGIFETIEYHTQKINIVVTNILFQKCHVRM